MSATRFSPRIFCLLLADAAILYGGVILAMYLRLGFAGSAVELGEKIGWMKIGVAAGTTSVTYVEDVIQPDSEPFIFNDNAAAKQALEDQQIDAIVSDLPTALYITAVEIEGTTVFGQIEGSGTDEFGLLMSKDNPIATCVDLALATLKASGELEQITTTWMSDYLDAPVISLG